MRKGLRVMIMPVVSGAPYPASSGKGRGGRENSARPLLPGRPPRRYTSAMRPAPHPFHSIYGHGYARVSVCIPSLKVADPAFNVGRTLELAKEACDAGSALVLFPELGIS